MTNGTQGPKDSPVVEEEDKSTQLFNRIKINSLLNPVPHKNNFSDTGLYCVAMGADDKPKTDDPYCFTDRFLVVREITV